MKLARAFIKEQYVSISIACERLASAEREPMITLDTGLAFPARKLCPEKGRETLAL